MAQLLIRQIDADDMARLKVRAKVNRTSVEALAREAVQRAAKLTGEEKVALARKAPAETAKLMIPGVDQTPGWVLIRQSRDGQ